MPKDSALEDNIFGDSVIVEKPKEKKGRQEDGTFVTSTGKVLTARAPRRIPYDEPEEYQVEGHVEVVERPDGSVSFECVRMNTTEFRKAGFPERKRLKLLYRVTEVYAGKPRSYYSYDELEQLRKGEMVR